MNRRDLRLAAWPHVAVIACVLLIAGCQDGSGPGLVTSPEGKPAFEGAKPPPPPPPPPADPAIVSVTGTNRRTNLHVMNADGSNFTTIFSNSYNDSWRMSPSWSPDGGSIAFIRSTGPSNAIVTEISAIDVDVVNGVPTGTNLRALFAGRFSPFETAWSPLGDQIAYIHGTSIKTIPAAGGDPLVVYTRQLHKNLRNIVESGGRRADCA